ncbi:MAG: cell division protein FtsZ [Chloroflexi bacterium]|nr:cell division protein FtsZ [Chloroflexota bacterium]
MGADLRFPKTTIKVIGLGGGGSNTIARMIEFGVQGVEFIAANTDDQVLRMNPAPIKVQLGPRLTGGHGAGGDPTVGLKAAEESREALAAALAGADMVFLTAGMGGGTGTGAIAVAAEVARSLGAVTVSVVTMPFSFEGTTRRRNAEEGLRRLMPHTDTLVVVPNDRLLEVAPKNLSLEGAFRLADEVLRRAIQGITDVITQTGVINRDFNDVRRLMASGGGALISMGVGKGENRVAEAIQSALNNPLLGDVSLEGATGVLANFVGGEDLTLWEVVEGMESLHSHLPEDADVIWGFNTDPAFEGRAQVILLITGVGAQPWEGMPQPQVRKVRREPATAAAHPAAANPAPAAPRRVPAPPPSAEVANDLELPAFLRRRLRSTAA